MALANYNLMTLLESVLPGYGWAYFNDEDHPLNQTKLEVDAERGGKQVIDAKAICFVIVAGFTGVVIQVGEAYKGMLLNVNVLKRWDIADVVAQSDVSSTPIEAIRMLFCSTVHVAGTLFNKVKASQQQPRRAGGRL